MEINCDKQITLQVWLVCALGLFIDGYDLYISAVAEPFTYALYHPSPFMNGLLQAAAPIGAALGALLIGRLADKIGRKSLLIFNLIFFILIALLSACAWDVYSLCFFRFLIGFGVGADYPICAAYLAELMPKNNSRAYIAAAMFFNCLASPVGAGVAWCMYKVYPSLDVWRLLFASGAIPALIALFLRSKLPESFVWKAHKKLHQNTLFLQHYKKLFSKQLKKTTICLCLSWFFLDISYYGVGLFTPSVLRALSLTEKIDLLSTADQMLINTLYINLFVVLGAFSSIFFIKKIHPLKLQKIGFFLSFVGLVVLGSHQVISSASSMVLIFSGFILFNFFINFGPGMTTYLLSAESYSSDLKATGHGMAACWGKMGAAIGTVFLPILQFYIGISITLLILGITLLLGWGLTFMLDVNHSDERFIAPTPIPASVS